jgi:predicted nucleic acid-binding protein
MDEQAGRRAAQYFGLDVMGVVGLLVRAKQRQLILAVSPLLESLQRQAGFYLSPAVIEHALELANED